jgi:hypothetical protein
MASDRCPRVTAAAFTAIFAARATTSDGWQRPRWHHLRRQHQHAGSKETPAAIGMGAHARARRGRPIDEIHRKRQNPGSAKKH